MVNELKLFLTGFANGFREDGYSNIVNPPKKFGEIASSLDKKRRRNHNRLIRVINERTDSISPR